MKPKERFLTAVNRNIPDRVPMFDFLFQKPMYQVLIGRQPDAYNAIDAVACACALNHDAVWVPFGGFSGYQPKYLSENVYIDEWGTTYQQSFASWPIDAPIAYPIKSRDDLRNYQPPDPTLPGRDIEIQKAVKLANREIAITGGVTGPFTSAWLMMGYEGISYSIYDDPDLVTDLFRIANEFNKEAARRSVEAGCDAIWVSDDLGDSQRGFLKLDHFRKLLFPYLADLVTYIDRLGVPVLLHSCGHIKDYLDDLTTIPIDAVHPLQRTAGMDLRYVKEKYGKRFCIIGNIDSSRTLPYGTPEDVKREVIESINIAAPGGGYILASDHSLHDGIPVENIQALFKTGMEYGSSFYQ